MSGILEIPLPREVLLGHLAKAMKEIRKMGVYDVMRFKSDLHADGLTEDELKQIEIVDKNENCSLSFTVALNGIGFNAVDLNDINNNALSEAVSDIQTIKNRSRKDVLERFEERIKQHMKQEIARAAVEEQLDRMKTSGQIDTYEYIDDLTGAKIYSAVDKNGINYRYRITTIGDVSIKNVDIKGEDALDVMLDLAKELNPDMNNYRIQHHECMKEQLDEHQKKIQQEADEAARKRKIKYEKQRKAAGKERVAISWG